MPFEQKIPAVCIIGYKDYKVDRCIDSNDPDKSDIHQAVCKFCKTGTTIAEKLGTTSKFVRHLKRKHKNK